MPTKTLLKIGPTLQAAGLATSTAKKAMKKDKGIKDIVGSAVEISVGAPLIKTQFDLIEGL